MILLSRLKTYRWPLNSIDTTCSQSFSSRAFQSHLGPIFLLHCFISSHTDFLSVPSIFHSPFHLRRMFMLFFPQNFKSPKLLTFTEFLIIFFPISAQKSPSCQRLLRQLRLIIRPCHTLAELLQMHLSQFLTVYVGDCLNTLFSLDDHMFHRVSSPPLLYPNCLTQKKAFDKCC